MRRQGRWHGPVAPRINCQWSLSPSLEPLVDPRLMTLAPAGFSFRGAAVITPTSAQVHVFNDGPSKGPWFEWVVDVLWADNA